LRNAEAPARILEMLPAATLVQETLDFAPGKIVKNSRRT
jgi:hypothetical protein